MRLSTAARLIFFIPLRSHVTHFTVVPLPVTSVGTMHEVQILFWQK